MNKNKIEINIQSKSKYYIKLFKKKLFTILKPIIVVLILVSTLYIGFYILLFVIVLMGIKYIFNNILR
mgnify:CR=1 FL=1|tara:strand:+ start:326 stop:529 length:204 start_codon:yes stop_codon:yes gene_type:complete